MTQYEALEEFLKVMDKPLYTAQPSDVEGEESRKLLASILRRIELADDAGLIPADEQSQLAILYRRVQVAHDVAQQRVMQAKIKAHC